MKVSEIRLIKDPERSFILFHDKNPFAPWHNHPEYELVLITKGSGIRTIGDHIDRFDQGDLILLGPYLPHEYRCVKECYRQDGSFTGECIVVQFMEDFLGTRFFSMPENARLKNRLYDSALGCRFHGKLEKQVAGYMMEMPHLNFTDQLYKLFSIFNLLASSEEYELLSTPSFMDHYLKNENDGWNKAIQYILQNFQEDIKLQDLLELTNMASTTFLEKFKKNYRMPFKRYLINIRIGYACRLLADDTFNISQVAYESGFENLSNFNRHFKALKGATPREYKKLMLGE